MGSCFYYLASFYHDELVGVLYRTEPVRDDNYRFPFIKFHQVLYNSPFVIGIQCIGRLVQKYIIRILVDTARAIRILCFCPWLSPIPSCPTVCYILMAKSGCSCRCKQCVRLEADVLCSTRRHLPQCCGPMLSEKMTPSCMTTPQCLRHHFRLYFCKSVLPMVISPANRGLIA